MPVSSRSDSGSSQRSGSWVPSVVVLYRMTSGMPASRSASKPTPIPSRVTMSSASSRALSTPNCSMTSYGAICPASLMTSATLSTSWKLPDPDSSLTRRVIRMSAIIARYLSGTAVMNCWPSSSRATLASSKTGCLPGRPSEAPVMTSGCAARPGRGAAGCAASCGSAPETDGSDWNTPSPSASTPANSSPSRAMVSGVTCTSAAERIRPGVATAAARTGAGAAAGAATGAGAAAGTSPMPAAYIPHRAWLNATASGVLGWFVNRATTSSYPPRTSSTNPCRAFFGPTSMKTRAPASYSVLSPLTNWTGEAICLPAKSSIVSGVAPAG